MTSRPVIAGFGLVYLAASTVTPLILKTAPSDLDLYFWPSAETVVAGHPLLIYSSHLHDLYPNANGPLGLVPLVPVAALANAFGWAGSLTGRAALAGAISSLFVLLLAFQGVQLIAAGRAGVRWPLAVACTVLVAPVTWIAVLQYGHVEQPVELCLVLLACSCFLSRRNAVTGIALGAAVLTRTIAGFCVIPFLLIPLATHRLRASATIAVAGAIIIAAGVAPFFVADARAVTHSLLGYRGSLPIGGGSFWVIARQSSWAALIKSADVYVSAAVAITVAALTLVRKRTVATTPAGLAGLLTIAACCFPLFAKTVFPYYLFEPYVVALIWWLARPGSALNWRVLVPLLLTADVFILNAETTTPFSTWGVVAGVVSSAALAAAIALVMLDLLTAPAPFPADDHPLEARPRNAPTVQDAI